MADGLGALAAVLGGWTLLAGSAVALLATTALVLPPPRTPRGRAFRNRGVTAGLVTGYLFATASILPEAETRATFHHYFVLTLGYGHLLGAALLSRRRIGVPRGVPAGLWRAFLGCGALTLFAVYGLSIQYAPTLVLLLLAVSTWHTAENDQTLAAAYASGGRMGPVARSPTSQLAAVGLALLVMAGASSTFTPAELEATVRGTAFERADFRLPCAAAAICGLVLLAGRGRGRRRSGGALVAGAAVLALTRPALTFGDVFAITTLYHLLSWLVLLADNARLAAAPARPVAARVVAVHLPAMLVCAGLLLLPAEPTATLRGLVFSPGIYLFASVLHVVQTAAVRGLAAPVRGGLAGTAPAKT